MEADALEALTAERRMKLEAREQAQLVANQSEPLGRRQVGLSLCAWVIEPNGPCFE